MSYPEDRIIWWPDPYKGYRIGYLETAFGWGAAYQTPPDERGEGRIRFEVCGKTSEFEILRERAEQLVERYITETTLKRLSGSPLIGDLMKNVKLAKPDTLQTVVIGCDKSQPSKTRRTKGTKSGTPRTAKSSSRRGAKTARRGRPGV